MRKHHIIAVLALILSLFLASSAFARIDTERKNSFSLSSTPLDTAMSADGKRLFVLAAGGKLFVYDTDGALNDTIEVDPEADRIEVSGLQTANIENTLLVINSKKKTVQRLALDFSVIVNTDGAPFLGSASAPVTIAVFSDFECPHCGKLGPLLEEALDAYPDSVKIFFKHYPLSFHQNARTAALAAIAAQNQGKFWQFHDRLFENQKNLVPETILGIAQQLQLDMARFMQDMRNADAAKKLATDMQDATNAGVTGTPTVFVNGRLMKERNIELLKKLIDEELAAAKRTGK
jgi:protein-disulfide isomerase